MNHIQEMLCAAKKPFKLTDSVTKFPQIKENDSIMELDSLEGSVISAEEEISSNGEADDNIKHLNLNGICNAEASECYVDEIVLPGESLQSLSDLKVLSLRSNGIQNFPTSILQLVTLTTLDLSDNSLLTLPPEISQLEK